ncbi:amidohydrolase family protein [Streptomyces uncialis]|uniref:amidohydrolase family protein n=1 Tax=Streptomyces uncialis TaxID=1048205 RepID=UPI0037F27EEA
MTAQPGGGGKIDVHHHFRPPDSAAARPGWSVARAVEEMDAAGVARAVAYAGPVDEPADGKRTAGVKARRINEFSAAIVRRHPGRFGTFASLPMLDRDACLEEIAYAADELGATGFGVSTCYGSRWLGDPFFRPVLEELDRRRAVLFVHPVDSWCPQLGYEAGVVTGPWLEWPANTARTILSLMVNGVLRDLPHIRFLFCHGGGLMPLLIGRIAGFTGWPVVGPERLAELFPEGIEAAFAGLYFECAQAYAPEAFGALRSLVPDSRLLFGSDYDNFPIAHSVSRLDALGLAPDAYDAISRGNAEQLMPAPR